MVSHVNNDALKTLLAAQSAGSQSSLSALKQNSNAQQAIIAPFQSGNTFSTSSSETINRAPNASLLANSGNTPPPSNLPRGSLVDIIA